MWRKYNPNPVQTEFEADDCAVRAISAALSISWEDAFWLLAENAFLMGTMPSVDLVWGSVLRQDGFSRKVIPNKCQDCYTVRDFCRDHPRGIYVIKTSGHVATVIDGILYDSQDTSASIPIFYWYK